LSAITDRFNARNQMSYGAAEVDLLRDGDNSDAALAPVRQHVDAFFETAGEAIKLPDHYSHDRAHKNSGL